MKKPITHPIPEIRHKINLYTIFINFSRLNYFNPHANIDTGDKWLFLKKELYYTFFKM